MPTDPLTASRYPSSSAAPNVNQDIQNAVIDLSDNTIPRFANAAARDTAYAAWVAAGGTMASGLTCFVSGAGYYQYAATEWVPLLGVVAYASQTTQQSVAASTETRLIGNLNVVLNLVSGRAYRVKSKGRLSSDTAGALVIVTVRGRPGATGTVTTSHTMIGTARNYLPAAGGSGQHDYDVEGLFGATTTGTYILSPFLLTTAGTATILADSRGRIDMWIEDAGPAPSGLITI